MLNIDVSILAGDIQTTHLTSHDLLVLDSLGLGWS